MKVGLITDAPKHNLALMKISTFHKQAGDDVKLNMPLWNADATYISQLFSRSVFCSVDSKIYIGGPSAPNKLSTILPASIETKKPDYDLFGLDYSLGYTYRPCFRNCSFCIVGKQRHPDTKHHSIWDIHNPVFDKIRLLNNNTFADPQWKETFEEIWDAKLTVIDENGYDLRLLSDEKAAALKKTKFEGYIHFAWDRMQDETEILRGLKIAQNHKLRGYVYVLVGFDTTEQDDLYRCQKIVDFGHNPYVMPYNQSRAEKRFKRFICSFMWRKYKTLQQAWKEYAA